MNKNEFKIKLKNFFKWIMPEAVIIVGGLLLDLISKALIQSNMQLGDTVTIIPKLLNFSYTINKRAAFGFDFGLGNLLGDSGVMIFFIVITFLAIGLFGYLLFKKPKKGMLYRVAFALIIAGALGNLYDRIFFAYVRDFIQIEYLGLTIFGSKTFSIFNVADSCVVIGVILLMIFILFFDKTFKNENGKREKAQETNNNTQQTVQEQSSNNTQQITTDGGADSDVIAADDKQEKAEQNASGLSE